MRKLSNDSIFMAQAVAAAGGSTCCRRCVGCVLVDQFNHVIAVGRNGVASGSVHCIDVPCPGADAPSGTGLDLCEAIHAEQNALIQCKDTMTISKAYCTASPCIQCVKMLMNTSCEEIIYLDEYPHPAAKLLWTKPIPLKGNWLDAGYTEPPTYSRKWRKFEDEGSLIKNLQDYIQMIRSVEYGSAQANS